MEKAKHSKTMTSHLKMKHFCNASILEDIHQWADGLKSNLDSYVAHSGPGLRKRISSGMPARRVAV